MKSFLVRHRGSVGVAAGLSVAALVAGGVAYAAVPNAAGVVNACYDDTTGALSVLQTNGATCAAGQTAIHWNAEGLDYRGAYDATVAYAKHDVVQESGSTFVALAKTKGNDPATTTGSWTVLAAQGPKGDTGAPGPKGDTGPQGPGGVSWALSVSAVSAASKPAYTVLKTVGPLTVSYLCWHDTSNSQDYVETHVTSSTTFALYEVIGSKLDSGTWSSGPASGTGLTAASLANWNYASGHVLQSYVSPAIVTFGTGASPTGYELAAEEDLSSTTHACTFHGNATAATS